VAALTDRFDSETAAGIELELKTMVEDGAFCTESSYSANGVDHPDHRISFVDKHMKYLRTHPSLSPKHYLSNLRLVTRVR
jgi:hypothetical protein